MSADSGGFSAEYAPFVWCHMTLVLESQHFFLCWSSHDAPLVMWDDRQDQYLTMYYWFKFSNRGVKRQNRWLDMKLGSYETERVNISSDLMREWRAGEEKGGENWGEATRGAGNRLRTNKADGHTCAKSSLIPSDIKHYTARLFLSNGTCHTSVSWRLNSEVFFFPQFFAE